MIQITPFSDKRLDLICSYCGENHPDTRDHVPSKILLNEPYPENLPVVPCCSKCNQSFSLDEEYVACLLECALHGTTNVEKLTRTKIKNILTKKENLRNRLSNGIILINGEISFNPEIERLENVFVKLAKGHIKYENSESEFEQPTHWGFKPLFKMSPKEKRLFHAHRELEKSPEVGSRALQKLLVAENNHVYLNWQIVQPDIYHYMVTINPLSVRMVIWNYLAAEVVW